VWSSSRASDDVELRRSVVQTLVGADEPGAQQVLRHAANDADEDVRVMAEAGLRRR
jgi:hypothetical protein